ncbi:MAG: hypothetical protein IJI41_06710 [Anaerolineaceae bacterium]|nr:hypothetical protein [Anaerolineaceae bacterium]
MPEDINYSPYVIVGKLSRDFILTDKGNDLNGVPGGHLLYSAIGMSPWEKHPGLVSRISKNYPELYIKLLEKHGLDVRSIKIVDDQIEDRCFINYFTKEHNSEKKDNIQKSVLTQYFNAGKPFPRELLGFNNRRIKTDSMTERTSETILARDIPKEYLEARCVHLCPMDYLSHNLLPQVFSKNRRATVSIQAGEGYMQPYFFEAIKSLLNGVSAFIVREKNLRKLFSENFRVSKLYEMMKILLDYGTDNIIVKANDSFFYFINNNDRIIRKLNYSQNSVYEKIGELSCFCGAFLVGLNQTYDYKKAVCYGVSRASLLSNEVNPYSNFDVYEGLVNEKAYALEKYIESQQ